MTFHLPDVSTPFGESVRRRVQEEYLAWLTVVDLHGMPQPAPIWFWWDEAVAPSKPEQRSPEQRNG